jgi:hypothetical protein
MIIRMTHNNQVREIADHAAQQLVNAGKAVQATGTAAPKAGETILSAGPAAS